MKLAAGSDRHSIAKCGSEDGQPPPPLPSPPYLVPSLNWLFIEGWWECKCLFKRQKLEGLHVVSYLQLYLKNLSMMCTPFTRNRVIHFIDMQIDFFLALQVHFKTRLHSNSHVKFGQNSIVFNVHYNTCIQRRLTHEQSLLHWINPAPDYVKIIFIEQLDHRLCSSTYQIFDRHSSDNFIGTLGNFITSSPSKVDILYPGHNLCSILQPILRMLVRGKL